MFSFKQYLKEKFKIDNPGGTWLKHKQEDANDDYPTYKGYNGATTGYFTGRLKIPVHHIKNMPGARGEHKFRNNDLKLMALEKEVGHPSNFDSKKHPILIGVNHKGESSILEGNHRLAYAHKHKISHIHAEVRYYNGGEEAKGNFHPDTIKHYEE